MMNGTEELDVASTIARQFATLSIPTRGFVLGLLQADVRRERTAPARRVLSRKRGAKKTKGKKGVEATPEAK